MMIVCGCRVSLTIILATSCYTLNEVTGTFVPGSENDVELSLPNIIYVLTCWNLELYFVCSLDRMLM